MTIIHANTIFHRANFATAHVHLVDQYSSTEADATWIKKEARAFSRRAAIGPDITYRMTRGLPKWRVANQTDDTTKASAS
jgi:hypothetical protein